MNRIGAHFTALRYFALDGTGPLATRSRPASSPVHHLGNNHPDGERLRQIVTAQSLP